MARGENGWRQRGPGLSERWIHPPNIKRCIEQGKKTSTPVVLVLCWLEICVELAKVSQLLDAKKLRAQPSPLSACGAFVSRGFTLRSLLTKLQQAPVFTVALPAMGNAILRDRDTSAPHFPWEAVFTAKYFQLLIYIQHFIQIKESEEYGQPSARTTGWDAFQSANTAHPTSSDLCGAVGTARKPLDPPGERGGKAKESRQTSGPARRAVGTQ